jgi:hypothetical protein
MEGFDSPQGFLANLREATTHGNRYSPWDSQLKRWKARLR